MLGTEVSGEVIDVADNIADGTLPETLFLNTFLVKCAERGFFCRKESSREIFILPKCCREVLLKQLLRFGEM